MKTAAFLALVGTSTAFTTPSIKSGWRSSLKADVTEPASVEDTPEAAPVAEVVVEAVEKPSKAAFTSTWKDETVVGITAPMGYFDPLGLSVGQPTEIMNLYREAELKHGRVAMAACLGWYVTAAGVHPAFNSSLSSDPLQAAKQLPLVGWLQFVLGCGAIEWLGEQIKKKPGYVPGDLLGTAFWVDDSDEGWVSYQNKEMNNGRLAMVAFMGIYVQDLLYGEYGDNIFRQG